MLDNAQSASAEGAWAMPTGAGRTVTLADATNFLQQQFWLIAGAMAAAMVLAALYVLFTPAEYVARAELLIEPGKQRALWQDNGVVDLTIDNAQVESQVEVLQSERIANDVIAHLGLVNDPEFLKPGSDYERQRATLGQFEGARSARRIGQSYAIEVSFRSRDPEKAARITNAITDAYLRDQQQAKRDVAQQASQWTEDQITDLGVKLNAAAAAVQQFRVSHGITDTGNNNQPQLIDKLTELEARAQAYRRVYEGLLQRFTENQEQASYPVSNARVITSASRPLTKAYPKTSLVMLLSIFVGLVIGVAGAGARSMLDGTVRSARQLRQSLGLAVLGSLPRCRPNPADGAAAGARVEVVDAPLSPFSEAMRNVRISVQRAGRGRPACCLGILSVLHDDGATKLATNLAALFEAAGSQTLLVDTDFRDRRLTRSLAPDARTGLVEAIRDGVGDQIVYDRRTRSHLLPLAGDTSTPNSIDQLDSPAGHTLLSQLKAKFATIIVDLPALKRTADMRAVAPLLDGCILVVVHGRTPLQALEEAVEILRADDVALLGVVITEASEGIPPLFGVHLDQVRDFDYGDYFQRLARVASR